MTGQGSKARMEKICARISASPCANQIRYLGFLDDDEYYKVINNCDIPCMVRNASVYANAGFPFKLGEYLATGNPTIASRVGDVTEYLVDRQHAVLVEPGSVVAIVNALEYVLDHPAEAHSIGLAGRHVAEQSFEKDRSGRELLEFLSAV
jgi:glycosyltransferase involved in cell wall biosynthesis